MADAEDDGFNENTFKALDEAPAPAADDSATPPVTPPAEPPKEEPKSTDEPKKEDPDEGTPPAGQPPADDQKPEEGAEPPKAPETPPKIDSEAPQPLTKDDVTAILSDIRLEERNSGKELESTAQEVLEAYYPDGLSNVLIDEKSGKELRLPQDVVDASGGEMSIDQAAQWLLNEQQKLNNTVAEIKDNARKIAETTVTFKRDATTVLNKYEPLFKAYPYLQEKAYNLMMKQVKADKEKGVILEAPDVLDLYDTYLEPYQKAYEFSTKQPATNPTPSTTPEPPKPSTEDRMDEHGDGGQTAPDDPNDFAQQVSKELAKGI